MTEGLSKRKRTAEILPTTHKGIDDVVSLVMTDMLKEMLGSWTVQPVYILLSSPGSGELVPLGTANWSWILQTVLGQYWSYMMQCLVLMWKMSHSVLDCFILMLCMRSTLEHCWTGQRY